MTSTLLQQAVAVPLVEQLRSVPMNAVLRIDTPNALGCMDTSSIPVGRLCHEAAAALQQQEEPVAICDQQMEAMFTERYPELAADIESLPRHDINRLAAGRYREFFKEGVCAAHLAAIQSGWTPIESAPKDGSLLLLATDKGVIVVGKRNKHLHIWVEADGRETPRHITHWMPLPSPPSLQQQQEPSGAVIPPAPPECETEDEKTVFAFGYWQGLNAARKQQEEPREVKRARKVGGSYQADGAIVSEFKTLAGKTRYVFEFDNPAGMLHIFGPEQVDLAASPSPQDFTLPMLEEGKERCVTCGETEPFRGSCGTGPRDARALCKRPPGVNALGEGQR